MRVPLSGAAVVLSTAVAAGNPADSGVVIVDRADIPAAVVQQVDCGTEPENIIRQPFAGGFVYRWPCAGNHANQVEAIVFAAAEDGTGARLLRFPAPGKPSAANPAAEIANVTFSASGEIGALFVNPETRICRSEARWRFDGGSQSPRLIHWRETRDCDGRRGWRIVVDRTSRAKSKQHQAAPSNSGKRGD